MWSVFLWKTIHVFCNHTFCDVKYFYFLLSKYSLIFGKGPLGGSRWKLLELTSVSRFLAYVINMIAHTIAKFHVRTKDVQMHKRVPCWTCPLDNGQRSDRPKNGRWTDCFKNDESFEKICSLQNISFSRYHIMYQITYIFTGWISLQQYVCRIRTTKCSSCKITW